MRLKSTPPRPRTGLIEDRAGATMVMGVFIAALLVGMIYYVWGIGDAIAYRERMQDAADTAAFSAAVMHARGMNVISLINMVMGALAVVAATMSTIAAMIGYAFGAATFVCAFCGPWCAPCCNACPYAVTHGVEFADARSRADDVSDTVESLMTGLRGYAVGIRYGVPLAAQAKVISYGTDIYEPVTSFGAMAPLSLEMPVQDDETNWPCDEKVLDPWVLAFSPTLVWVFGTASPYMAGGVIAGELDARRITRQWCEDGYFQRVTDEAREQGNDSYQVQAYMFGDHDLDWSAQGVAIATWGEGEGAGENFTRLAQMGRISFAQGEYFYDDGEDDYREWLWHMNWRARLRRWRLSAAGSGLDAVCGGQAGCGVLGELGGAIDDVVVH